MLNYSGMSWKRARFLRFLRVLNYICYHAAIYAGTSWAYSLITAGFVTYVADPNNSDDELFKQIFWPTLLIAILVAIKETAMYSLFSFHYFNLSDNDFDSWLNKKYKKSWRYFGYSTAVLKACLGGMSFGATMGHTISFLDNSAKTQRIAASIGLPVGVLAYLCQTFYYYRAEHHNFDGCKVMASSIAVSLPSVTNYIMATLMTLQTDKSLSRKAKRDAYITLSIFSAFAIYYYTRMYYETEIKKAKAAAIKDGDNPEAIKSWFSKLDGCINYCYEKTGSNTLKTLLTGIDKLRRFIIIGGFVSGGLVYGMWLTWRTTVIRLGYFKSEQLELYPTGTTFDVITLSLLGFCNLICRSLRFDGTANKWLDNNSQPAIEAATPLLSQKDNITNDNANDLPTSSA